MRVITAIALAACSKAPESAPATGSGSATAPTDAAVVVAVADAAVPVDAAPAPAGPPVDEKMMITATQFGPYKAGTKFTKASLEKLFKWTLKTIEHGGGEGERGDPAWFVEAVDGEDDGAVSRLLVMKDGSLWVTSARKVFTDQHGLRPGVTSDVLVATIKDLECENIESEEPEFSCWSKAVPQLRYLGTHGYALENGFTKAQLAKLKLTVEHFDWKPK